MCFVPVCMTEYKEVYPVLMVVVFGFWGYSSLSPLASFPSPLVHALTHTHTPKCLYWSGLCPCCSLCLECLSLISAYLNSSYFQKPLPKGLLKNYYMNTVRALFRQVLHNIPRYAHIIIYLMIVLWRAFGLFLKSRSLSSLAVPPWASQIILLIPIFSSVKL